MKEKRLAIADSWRPSVGRAFLVKFGQDEGYLKCEAMLSPELSPKANVLFCGERDAFMAVDCGAGGKIEAAWECKSLNGARKKMREILSRGRK